MLPGEDGLLEAKGAGVGVVDRTHLIGGRQVGTRASKYHLFLVLAQKAESVGGQDARK